MTKEQDKAIERCKNLIRKEHSSWIGISNQKAIEKLLNMLKEKDTEIEKYKNLLASNLAKNLNDSIKAKEKANTDLEFLNLGWKTEIEKKDKMIDLMAVEIEDVSSNSYCNSTKECIEGECKNCIKQYFERKATNDG